jgi:hypothetical protein
MKNNYQEGDLFGVSLRGGGWCLGVVARKPKGGKVLLGYFFDPRLHELPSIDNLPSLIPSKARRVARFGDLNLIKGKWPIIGRITNWRRADWPMPQFISHDPLVNRAYLITYADDDPAEIIDKKLCSNIVSNYAEAGLWGAGYTEIILDKEM